MSKPLKPTAQDVVERAADQKMLLSQRDANEQLVLATIRGLEAVDHAEAAQATAETTVEALKVSEQALLVTAEFREQLLGIVGHDLRNPLGAISMCAQILSQTGDLSAENEKLVALLLRSVERMTRMIDQLSEFTRARLGGGMSLTLASTDLRKLCQRAVEELTLVSAVPVVLEFHQELAGSWDAERLMAVFSNLVGNAIDHAAPGSSVIVKGTREGAEAVVEVCNQGEPIPAKMLPVLFTPFHGSRQPQTSRHGHLGLGLYIAHEIIRSHGGTLQAQSEAGTTRFVLRLPHLHKPTES